MSQVTYRDGVATITTPSSKTEIDVALTSGLILAGDVGDIVRTSVLDTVALAAGFAHLSRENDALRDELAAARAGVIGREHASEMQNARAALAKLNGAVDRFMQVYDTGNAPDSVQEEELRDALSDVCAWLIHDSSAAIERAKVLKGGAA